MLTVLQGDCREVMQGLAESSVDSVVTDPPYELGFMAKTWDRSGIAYDLNVWIECLRALKPGGHLLAFGGSRTYHRLACAIEDAGFEIRDTITWLFGSGFPKSLSVSKAIDAAAGAEREVVVERFDGRTKHVGASFDDDSYEWPGTRHITAPTTDAAKQWDGWGTALKPAAEYITLARKPLAEKTVAENVLTHGTGGLNIDGCRVVYESTSDYQRNSAFDRIATPGMFGKGGASPAVTPEGRWPANVIHSGEPEVLAGFPDLHGAGSARIGGASRTGDGGLYHGLGNHEGCGTRIGDDGSAARFFYCAKASKEDREEGLESLPIRSAGEVTDRQDGSDGLSSPRAGAGRINGSRNHHPTVKPTDLMRYLCRLVTPPGGTVLDPFCGSGSTGKAAILERLNFIGIELSAEYCELAEKRIEAVTRQGLLMFA